MRLWHVDLIPYLPRQQLLGQWRECVLIAKNLAEKGTPNHVLVNRILDYPCFDFAMYTRTVINEMLKRNYKINDKVCDKFDKYIKQWKENRKDGRILRESHHAFPYWHNNRYLDQCFYNLQEKFDCGAINEFEFNRVQCGYELLRYGSV